MCFELVCAAAITTEATAVADLRTSGGRPVSRLAVGAVGSPVAFAEEGSVSAVVTCSVVAEAARVEAHRLRWTGRLFAAAVHVGALDQVLRHTEITCRHDVATARVKAGINAVLRLPGITETRCTAIRRTPLFLPDAEQLTEIDARFLSVGRERRKGWDIKVGAYTAELSLDLGLGRTDFVRWDGPICCGAHALCVAGGAIVAAIKHLRTRATRFAAGAQAGVAAAGQCE